MSAATHRKAQVTLPTEDQILITRSFDAPKHLVFRAWTTPELVRRWFHANRGEMTTCEIDLRPGGAWRYVLRAPDGQEFGWHGEYREVVAGQRLVSTEIFEPVPDVVALNTVTFEDGEGGSETTRATILVQHPNQISRDAHLNAGMEDGLQDALDLLEALARRDA